MSNTNWGRAQRLRSGGSSQCGPVEFLDKVKLPCKDCAAFVASFRVHVVYAATLWLCLDRIHWSASDCMTLCGEDKTTKFSRTRESTRHCSVMGSHRQCRIEASLDTLVRKIDTACASRRARYATLLGVCFVTKPSIRGMEHPKHYGDGVE